MDKTVRYQFCLNYLQRMLKKTFKTTIEDKTTCFLELLLFHILNL
jgi:hypothetical protein